MPPTRAGNKIVTTYGEQDRLTSHREQLQAAPGVTSGAIPAETSAIFTSIVSCNRKMRAIFRYIEVIAPTAPPVMITGETGTGKEMIARVLHDASGLSGNFVPVNISGLDDTTFSDLLFGHIRGACTDAEQVCGGLIEAAAGGTLFLDEIGALSPASQIKLLRLIKESEYYQLGSDRMMTSTARIVVATHCNLEKLLSEGTFRKDLYFRLCSHHIILPALRQRKNDIPLLVHHFLHEAAREMSRPLPLPSAESLEALRHYDFPGNVRELKELICNAVATSPAGTLVLPKLKPSNKISPVTPTGIDFSSLSLPSGRIPTLNEAEEFLIKEALRVTSGNQPAAAHILGITPHEFSRRLLRDSNLLT
ncbi:MAG: sigma-54-dependent transcriptional regulator [Desulfuromonadaceae bacterium]